MTTSDTIDAPGEITVIDDVVASRVSAIRGFLDEFGPDYLYVLVSGGKDSVAAWALTCSATRDYVAVYLHIPGQTHVDNVRAVYGVAERLGVRDRVSVIVSETRGIGKRLSEALSSCGRPCLLHVLVFTHRGEDYWAALRRYGYPAPLGRWGGGTRWCCGVFKHRVFNRLPFNGRRGGVPWRFGVDGSKATDSPYRRKIYTRDVMTWERTRDTYLLVLRTLTDEQVWDILRSYGLYSLVAAQYEKWGRAPNCMFCPLLGRRKAEKAASAMSPAQKRFIAMNLHGLLSRYREGTFSHRSINMWLRVLGDGIDAETGDE